MEMRGRMLGVFFYSGNKIFGKCKGYKCNLSKLPTPRFVNFLLSFRYIFFYHNFFTYFSSIVSNLPLILNPKFSFSFSERTLSKNTIKNYQHKCISLYKFPSIDIFFIYFSSIVSDLHLSQTQNYSFLSQKEHSKNTIKNYQHEYISLYKFSSIHIFFTHFSSIVLNLHLSQTQNYSFLSQKEHSKNTLKNYQHEYTLHYKFPSTHISFTHFSSIAPLHISLPSFQTNHLSRNLQIFSFSSRRFEHPPKSTKITALNKYNNLYFSRRGYNSPGISVPHYIPGIVPYQSEK